MGGLTSQPKIPKTAPQTQVVYYVPSQATTTGTATGKTTTTNTATSQGGSGGTTSAATGGSTNTTASTEDIQTQAREQSLLTRSRGIFGTVQTSFRGLLGLAGGNDNGNGRKTLLGE